MLVACRAEWGYTPVPMRLSIPVAALCGLTLAGALAAEPAMPFAGAVQAVCAVPAPGPAGGGERELIGGSAVVIAPGLALSLQEAFTVPAAVGSGLTLALPRGIRRAATVERVGPATTAVLLRLDTSGCPVLPTADPQALPVGAPVWTIGNATGAVEDDGQGAVSRGTLSGRYELPTDAPVMRGRAGRVLSTYRGPVFEIDAAVNDGSQGGAVVDADGRVVGLASLAFARERRLGTAIPIDRLLADVGLPPPGSGAVPMASAVLPVPPGIVLVGFDRPQGLGNPAAVPRPPRTPDQVPVYDRPRIERWWDAYHHSQQVLWTDSPASALLIDAQAGLVLTAASHVRGATGGRLLSVTGTPRLRVLAIDAPLDLALLTADGPIDLDPAVIDASVPALGEAIAVVARHRTEVGPTRTAGIVSCSGRRLDKAGLGFMQLDARANYGSLGGAVVGAQGRVVGMVVRSSPEAPWLINSGVTLAVDGATIAAALPALRAGTSRDQLPFLGLGVRFLPDASRVTIDTVLPASPAAAAGMRTGDIIVVVDGRPAASSVAVTRALMHHRAGDQVQVVLERGGQPLTLTVTLQELEL